MDAKVHTSAHPHLAPARAEQVIQFLLARNYHLTALELLVESQSSGHDGEFPELELFFSNPDRFPPEEVLKHAQANALDLQALSREREHKLQLLEYELRLAKEDLAAMGRKLAAASQPPTPTTALATSPRLSQHLRPAGSEPLSSTISIGGFSGGPDGASVSAGGALPTAASNRAAGLGRTGSGMGAGGGAGGFGPTSGAAGAVPDLSQGLVVERNESMPNPFAKLSMNGGDGPPQPLGSEQLDWTQLGVPTDAEHSVVLACMVSYCLHLGLRTTAMTLREEATDALPGSNVGELLQSGRTEGLALWKWYKLAKSALTEHGSAALDGQLDAQLRVELEELKARAAELQAALARSEADCAAARATAGSAAAQVASLRKALEDASQGKTDVTTPPALGLLAASSMELARSPGLTAFQASGSMVRRTPSAAADQAMQAAIVAQLTDLLPRIMPALTIKTRLEILPMVQAVILAAQDPDTQRALTGLVFNGVATPDPSQRGAVVALCVGVAARLGPAWAAQELLASCTKQVSSPSAERRVLVAEMMTALLNPALVHMLGTPHGSHGAAHMEPGMPPMVVTGPLIDCGTQSHALLTALHRLAEDRMEQVREAAVAALVALLKPGCLTFSRTYYTTLEELLMQLVCDTDSVSGLALDSLAPALQAWASTHQDLIATSLLPRVISDVSRLSRDASTHLNPPPTPPPTTFAGNTLTYSVLTPAAAPAAVGGASPGVSSVLRETASMPVGSFGLPSASPSPNNLGQRPSVGARGGFQPSGPQQAFNTQRFACWEHQAMYQLLQLYTLLLPSLRTSALQAVPAWAIAAAASSLDHLGLPRTSDLGPALDHHHRHSQSLDYSPTDNQPPTTHDQPPSKTDGGLAVDDNKNTACGGGRAHRTSSDHHSSPALESLNNPSGAHGQGDGGQVQRASSTGDLDAEGVRPSSGGSSMNTFVMHGDLQGGGSDFLGTYQGGTFTIGGSTKEGHLSHLNVQELVAAGELDAQALFAACGTSDRSGQWKRMQWVLQFLLPEFIELSKALGSPTHLQLPGSSSQQQQTSGAGQAAQHVNISDGQGNSSFSGPTPGGGLNAVVSCLNLQKQLSKVLALTATTFGTGWTHSVLLPVFSASAGCSAPAQHGGSTTQHAQHGGSMTGAPPHSQSGSTAGAGAAGGGGNTTLQQQQQQHSGGGASIGGPLQEAIEQLGPQTPAAAQVARTCVLPHLLCSVLPYASPSATSDWLLALTHHTQDTLPSYQQLPPFFGLHQSAGAPPHPQWLAVAQQQLSAAVGYACNTNGLVVSQVLQVLERLAHNKPPPATSTSGTSRANPAPTKLSGLAGAVALALAQGTLPLVGAPTTSSGTPSHSSHAPTSHSHLPDLEIGPDHMPPAPLPAHPPTSPDLHDSNIDLNSNLNSKKGDVELPPMPVVPSAPPTGAALARKVMSLLMVILSEGDLEVQCGVVLVLLDVLLRYKGGGGEDSKLVEQVCVVYDGLLASGSPPLVSSVLGAAQQLAVATAPGAARSAAAAQLLEWVLQAVLVLAGQLAPPAAGSTAATQQTAPYPTDHQRHMAVQLLCVTHAMFMQDVQLPRLLSALQGCTKALNVIRPLLPDPYAAVITPMLAGNRPAAGTAMAHAVSAAAAMSAVAAPQGVAGASAWGGSAGYAGPGGPKPGAATGQAGAYAQAGPPAQQLQQGVAAQQQQRQQPAGSGGQPPPHPGAAAQEGLSSRFEKLKSRFRKKSVADGELENPPS